MEVAVSECVSGRLSQRWMVGLSARAHAAIRRIIWSGGWAPLYRPNEADVVKACIVEILSVDMCSTFQTKHSAGAHRRRMRRSVCASGGERRPQDAAMKTMVSAHSSWTTCSCASLCNATTTNRQRRGWKHPRAAAATTACGSPVMYIYLLSQQNLKTLLKCAWLKLI